MYSMAMRKVLCRARKQRGRVVQGVRVLYWEIWSSVPSASIIKKVIGDKVIKGFPTLLEIFCG